ncbi:hypothetical protein GCM10027093_70070 [Paraburkholderia jirisanensis]
MNDPKKGTLAPTLLTLGVLAILLFKFGRYIQGNSYDLMQHFILVDELMRYGTVLPGDIQSMSYYPAGSHWIAAVVGWAAGMSGIVAITFVSIASVYFSYVLIVRLVGASSPVRVLLLAGAFVALKFTRSMIGWEVVLNYFYSQLVTDVLYFGILLWLVRTRTIWQQVVVLLVVSWFAMWVHSLAPLHLLATGCVLMAFQIIEAWRKRTGILAPVTALVALLAGAAVIAVKNPAFRAMRNISTNDGWLTFGYSNFAAVAVVCGFFGLWNLWRCYRERGERTDAVIGCAMVAAVCLVFLQLAALKVEGAGSAYAVKKHMFIIVTLGIMNAVRVFAAFIPSPKWQMPAWAVAPVLAGAASLTVLHSFSTPVGPIVRALAYADHAIRYELPNFKPGDFVSDVDGIPVMGNVMVSMGPFKHPFDERVSSWVVGTPIRDAAKFAMVRNTPVVDRACSTQYAASHEYTIIDPACLRIYRLGDTLTFNTNGTGWNFASNGWSGPESWGSWTNGDGGILNMTLADPVQGPLMLTADGMVYVNEKHPSQRVDIVVNGTNIGSWTYTHEAPTGSRSVEIPESIARSGKLNIVFKGIDAVSPLQLGDSEDGRVLGLGIKSIRLTAH